MTFVRLDEAAIRWISNAYIPAASFPTGWSIAPAAKNAGVSSLGYVEIQARRKQRAFYITSAYYYQNIFAKTWLCQLSN
jgi:hypothetical protein